MPAPTTITATAAIAVLSTGANALRGRGGTGATCAGLAFVAVPCPAIIARTDCVSLIHSGCEASPGVHSLRSAVCTMPKPIGGSTASSRRGMSTPRRLPVVASSWTHSEWMERWVHTGMTTFASVSALEIELA